jgi:hypothetical protein
MTLVLRRQVRSHYSHVKLSDTPKGRSVASTTHKGIATWRACYDDDRLGSPRDICIIMHLLVGFALQSENIRAPGRVRCFRLRIRERLVALWRHGVEESARSLLPCLKPQMRLNWPGGDTLEHVVSLLGSMSRCTLQSHILNAEVPQHYNHTYNAAHVHGYWHR